MSIAASSLLHLTPEGLFCPEANAHVDPVRRVPRAIITHAHSDHARAGHGAVLATEETLDIMALRYGEGFCGQRQTLSYGQRLDLGGVALTLRPAGHVLGSAQVVLEARGQGPSSRAITSGRQIPPVRPSSLSPAMSS